MPLPSPSEVEAAIKVLQSLAGNNYIVIAPGSDKAFCGNTVEDAAARADSYTKRIKKPNG